LAIGIVLLTLSSLTHTLYAGLELAGNVLFWSNERPLEIPNKTESSGICDSDQVQYAPRADTLPHVLRAAVMNYLTDQ